MRTTAAAALTRPLLLPQVFISGSESLNRAVHEDIVAIEMLPKDAWTSPSSVLLEFDEKNDNDVDDEVCQGQGRVLMGIIIWTCMFDPDRDLKVIGSLLEYLLE